MPDDNGVDSADSADSVDSANSVDSAYSDGGAGRVTRDERRTLFAAGCTTLCYSCGRLLP